MTLRNDAVIALRVTPGEKELLRDAARLECKSLSAFIRQHAEASARKVLGDEWKKNQIEKWEGRK